MPSSWRDRARALAALSRAAPPFRAQATLVLLAAVAVHAVHGKVFEVVWDVPSNGLILPSVSTAKCGDVVRFKCPPGAVHGVYRMTSVDGACPKSFDLPSAGVVLSAPTAGCDFSITLGDEPDFFVTSQAGDACAQNLKLNVHSVCPQTTGTSASAVLGMGSEASLNGGLLGRMPGTLGAGVITPGSALASAMGGAGGVEARRSSLGLAPSGAPGLPEGGVAPMMEESDELLGMEAGSMNGAAARGALPLAAVLLAGAASALVLCRAAATAAAAPRPGPAHTPPRPPAHAAAAAAGDLIYDGLRNGFRGEQFGGPPPAPRGADVAALAAGAGALLDVMVGRGYALRAEVGDVAPAPGGGPGGGFTVRVTGPCNLWSMAALGARRALVTNAYDVMAVDAWLHASGRAGAFELQLTESGLEERWTAAARARARAAGVPRAHNSNGGKALDVVGLSNLCVDVVINVPELPPDDPAARAALLSQLAAAPPDEGAWELGGNCNFMIAAARLGMRVGSIGHAGDDAPGRYMDRVLAAERIAAITRVTPPPAAAAAAAAAADATLLCFVLVDPAGRHAFCSRYDFGPWPLLAGVRSLPPSVEQVLRSTSAVFTNGFVFDELPLDLVKAAIATASEAGAAVLFDPGPRAFTMRSGSRRAALDALMDLSDVILMTQEEAVEVTGLADPQAAAEAVLARPGARTEWCVVKLGGEGALLVTKSPEQQVFRAGAFKVTVADTVGCGDSFAAAIVLGYTRSHDVHATLLLANAVGAATAMGRGAGTNVADAPTVLSLLAAARGAAAGAAERADVDNALAILQGSLGAADVGGKQAAARAA
ncbi:iolC [Scenedesmus sp. PABB004]|nr:iolC [Scenedesmus sp. PABB004]